MSKLKHFLLNGQEYSTESDLTVLELIQYFNYNTSLLVLEYNNLICNKRVGLTPQTNDKIEIVTIVGRIIL
jgi:sulfur carrier protein ThiS